MDAIRVAKVERVICRKAGRTSTGTVHLTAHHLIFHYDEADSEEMWVAYPLISLVTRLPITLQGHCPLTIRTRTFESLTLLLSSETDAIDVFESIKELTVAPSVTQLYAFYYAPNPPYAAQNGWSIYSPREEFGRMGVGTRSKAWRFTDINKDYSFSPTYPARLVIPTRISDTTLQYAVKYRSKGRLPVLTYLHRANFGSITRSSQPMVGLTSNRSIQDEKLIQAIFQTHWSPDARVSSVPVYGATATNLIIDARPTTNAVANTAKGAGTENMDHYKEAKKAYLGIDNIHVMRDSLAKMVEVLREADVLSATGLGLGDGNLGENAVALVLDRQALRRSGWLKHLSAIMEGALLIVRNVHVNSSHVLIHCSDGWDRTAQLSALAQLCLDPFYRTVRGFQILVEKDWLSFGHRFLDRCGHLSSDKFFIAPVENAGGGGGAEAAQAFLASVQNRFASQHHLKETSPVFHQWLECVRQVQRQFPERFEFNERFLRQLHYHLYSCQFGTFLFNTERERRVGEGGPPPCDRTISVWDFFNSPPETNLNINPDYDPSLDDLMNRNPKTDMGVLMINSKDVRFWHELYGRTDEEMNGTFVAQQIVQDPEFIGPIEGSVEDPIISQGTTPSSSCISSSSATSPSSSSPIPQTSKAAEESDPSSHQASLVSESPISRHDSLTHHGTSSPIRIARKLNARSPSPALQPSSPSRPVTTNQVADLFSSSNVRSMWGRFSSNASAAFSVVQDTYGNVAKDFKGLSLGVGSASDTPGGELKTRDEINAWGQDHEHESRPATPHASSAAAQTVGPSTNPWSTTTRSMPSMFMDNPWSSPYSLTAEPNPLSRSQPPGKPSPKALTDLSLDPTVSLPEPSWPSPLGLDDHDTRLPAGPLAPSTIVRAHSFTSSRPLPSPSSSIPTPTNQTQPSTSSDPLGVGLS